MSKTSVYIGLEVEICDRSHGLAFHLDAFCVI